MSNTLGVNTGFVGCIIGPRPVVVATRVLNPEEPTPNSDYRGLEPAGPDVGIMSMFRAQVDAATTT